MKKKTKPQEGTKKSISKVHDHSKIIHGRSHQTDKYIDGCLVYPTPRLGHPGPKRA